MPHETAAILAQVLCTSYNRAPCHFMQSHIRKVYVCLAVTCHLHFWQNDRDLLRATVVTRGWNGYRNKSQHRKSTLEKKILPPLQQGFEPATFQSRVRRSNHWAIPTPGDNETMSWETNVILRWSCSLPFKATNAAQRANIKHSHLQSPWHEITEWVSTRMVVVVAVVRELLSLVTSVIRVRIRGHRSEVTKIVYHMALSFCLLLCSYQWICRDHFHFILLCKH